MQTRTVDHVESWESHPFTGGYGALHDLADDSFSGVVVADDSWLFMLNGRVVGVFEGSIEDFEDADGTVYEAPHLSLPLLFAMLEEGGETRAKYYTEDTPLPETDETLTDSNFVGYVELSENVLSGDYYSVYYGGRSMSAAFVGASGDLVTGEEAFERAADEVGVYEVVSVDLDIVDVPEPAEPAEPAAGASGATAVDAGDEDTGVEESAELGSESVDTGNASGVSESDVAVLETDTESSGVETDEQGDEVPDETVTGVDVGDAARSTSAVGTETEVTDESESEAETEAEPEAEAASEPRPAVERVEGEDNRRSSTGHTVAPETESPTSVESEESIGSETGASSEGVFREEEAWREMTTIPAIDPEESGAVTGAAAEEGGDTGGPEPAAREPGHADESVAQASGGAEAEPSEPEPSKAGPSEAEQRAAERVERLRAAVTERDERIEELEAKLHDAEQRLDTRRTELDRLREERDDLADRVEDLEEQLAEARASAATGGTNAGPAGAEQSGPTERTPEEALSGTNLFVRYESKADPTLEALETGDATAEQINANLRLEHHTQFDATDATVGGDPFAQFLERSAHYRFVSWVVRELPYEILDTGHRNGLSGLFEAIADVDRAELDGVVSVRDDTGEEHSHTFDVVLRDRMGNPLVVADVNESRDPVPSDEMDALVESARDIATESETLASAVYVTASFFEPGALEVADEETDSGGFLRGSDKDSFVKVSRKRGFHLCLVEDRNESFHVTVPEL